MKKIEKSIKSSSKAKLKDNLVSLDEEKHDRVSAIERKRRELEKEKSLERSVAKIPSNGGNEGRLEKLDGQWSVQYDYGKVAIHNELAQGTSYMSKEDYAELRYWMAQLEAARRGHNDARDKVRDLLESGKAYSVTALQTILLSSEKLEAIEHRKRENECIIHSIGAVANTLDRVPTKKEVREYHGKDRPPTDKEPRGYKGRHYEAPDWNAKLKKIGFDWLPIDVRGKNRI